MSDRYAPPGGPAPTPPAFTQTRAGREMGESAFNRFIGGSPVAVFARLLFVSLVVGALLVWLDIRPYDLIAGLERLFRRIWALGFDAVREVIEYIAVGAAVVVPVWLVMRLLGAKKG